MAQLPFRRGNPIREFIAHKIIRRAARRNDHRQTASHRLQHGQAETLAAIRQHKTITRGVKSGQ
jgi:hypothetical protein